MEEFKLNEFQTKLDSELLNNIPREVYNNILEYINGVEFIKNLSDVNIPEVKDLPKDNNGKIILWEQDSNDKIIHNYITKPHKLVNMDYFRPAALYYKEHGCYTHLTPNTHPKSPYRKYWKEEKKRCTEGYVREDGEWIPGILYFYWNYCPIMLSREVGNTKKAIRVQDFPDPWLGDYLWYHYKNAAREYGMHCAKIKCRGIGASFKGGVDGPHRSLFFKKQKTFYIAYEKEYLNKDGILNKAWDYMDFLAQNTPFPRMRLIDSLNRMVMKLGYKDLDDGTEKGTLGEIIGISTKDDPDKPRGKRGSILFEEFGKYPKVTDTWNICRPSVEDGDFAFDQLTAFGTGGSENSDFQGAEDMMYNPDTYKILGLPNVFDLNSQGGKSIFHWGSYLSRKGCMNKDGMPDVVKALKEVFLEFYKIRQTSTDGKALTQRRAELAVTIKDAIMKVDGTLFPVGDIKDIVANIMTNYRSFIRTHFVGKFIITSSGTVDFVEELTATPIRDYPIKDKMRTSGAVEIFEKPITNSSGKPIKHRYISGLDGFDDDHSTTTSLGSIFVLDTFTDRIVAEYTGRPRTANDFYEIARRMLIYYNAICNYENDKKGLYSYFLQHHSLYLLCDNPEILEEKNIAHIKTNYGNKKVGTNSSKLVNAWGRRLQADWLIKSAYGTKEEKENKDEVEKIVLNMHKIRSIGYLKELMAWNPDGNFDRVSAMGMLMILKEEVSRFEKIKVEDRKSTARAQLENHFARFQV